MPCQEKLMKTIINQLKDSNDHIYINSQTGTGKTLSLLCSLFALNTKRIIYVSRTHS